MRSAWIDSLYTSTRAHTPGLKVRQFSASDVDDSKKKNDEATDPKINMKHILYVGTSCGSFLGPRQVWESLLCGVSERDQVPIETMHMPAVDLLCSVRACLHLHWIFYLFIIWCPVLATL